MSTIGNLIWLLLGGLLMALGWAIAGCVAFLTIIFAPWGKACFTIARLTLMPFGSEVVERRQLTGQDDIGTGPLGLAGNIIWLIFGGLWLALGHAIAGVFACITLIGIPFGLQHFKLARLALMPIGKEVVAKGLAGAKVALS